MSAVHETHPSTRAAAMSAQPPGVSILAEGLGRIREPVGGDVLEDLRLDHVLAALSTNEQDNVMVELFTQSPEDPDTVDYRQEVASDLRDPAVREVAATFRVGMARIDKHVSAATASAGREYYWQKLRQLTEAMTDYTEVVRELLSGLESTVLHSRGMSRFRAYLHDYVASPAFEELTRSTATVMEALDQVRFSILMTMGQISLTPAAQEGSYTDEMAALFERFRDSQEDVAIGKRVDDPGITHITAQIVAQEARMQPAPFQALEEHWRCHADFVDATLGRFARESGFFLSYLDYIAPLERAGLLFCRPRIVVDGKRLEAHDAFDLPLAVHLIERGEDVVTNDASLVGAERVLVITGPNQGGKTTYARMIGQLHHLASIGLPVPGHDVELPLVDQVLTQFERAEGRDDPTGKLEEELQRLRKMFTSATPRSVLVLNESFTSTSLRDARELGTRVLEKAIAADMLAVYVTFVDELSRLGPATVSLVSQTAPEDPDRRTFKVSRQPADGTARALAIAEKNGLTRAQLLERIPT